MKCSDCGKEIEKSADYCPNCGNPINISKYDAYLKNRGKLDKKTLKKVIIIILVYVLILVLAVILGAVLALS